MYINYKGIERFVKERRVARRKKFVATIATSLLLSIVILGVPFIWIPSR